MAMAAPDDKGNAAYLLFLVLGTGVLLPYNSFVTGADYFKERFKDENPEFVFAWVYSIPNIIMLVVVVKWGHLLSLKVKMVGSFLIYTALMIYMPMLDFVEHDVAFWLTTFGVFLIGIVTSVCQGSILGYGGLFPAQYMQALMTGGALSGFLICAVRAITKGSLPSDSAGLRDSAIIYFAVAALICLVCVISIIYLETLAFTKHYARLGSVDFDTEPLMAEENGQRLSSGPGSPTKPPLSKWEVFMKIKVCAFNVWVNFFITLSLFPGVMLEKSSDELGSWTPVILVALFNTGDTIGRTLPKYFILFTHNSLVLLNILRLGFYPLIILTVKPLVFENDWWACIFALLFAITNGYGASLAMMFGPECVDAKDKETAGTIMVFFLAFGLLCGSSLGYGFSSLVK